MKKSIQTILLALVLTNCSDKKTNVDDQTNIISKAPEQDSLILVKNCDDLYNLVTYVDNKPKPYQDSFISFKFVKHILNIPTPNNDSSISFVKCSASIDSRLADTYCFMLEYYFYKNIDSLRYRGPVFIDKKCNLIRYLLKNKDAGKVLDFFALNDSVERAYIGNGMPDGYTMQDYYADKEKFKNKKRK